MNLQTRGRGFKNPKVLQTSFKYGPKGILIRDKDGKTMRVRKSGNLRQKEENLEMAAVSYMGTRSCEKAPFKFCEESTNQDDGLCFDCPGQWDKSKGGKFKMSLSFPESSLASPVVLATFAAGGGFAAGAPRSGVQRLQLLSTNFSDTHGGQEQGWQDQLL